MLLFVCAFRLQVNVISTGLLAILLLPLLAQTAEQFPSPDFKPHLTIVASEGLPHFAPFYPLSQAASDLCIRAAHSFAFYKESKIPGSILVALNTKEYYRARDRFRLFLFFSSLPLA